MLSLYKKISLTVLFFLGFALIPSVGSTAGRMYFSAMAEPDEDAGGTPMITLKWGAVNGTLPSEIAAFRLYRSENGGENSLLAEISYTPDSVDSATIRQLVDNDLSWRKNSLIRTLQTIQQGDEPVIDSVNYAPVLHSLLTGEGQYAPFQKMMLINRFPAVAAALGLSWTDKTVRPGNSYVYLLTALDSSGAESNLLGRSDPLDPADISKLLAPADFRQVRVGKCDGLRRGMDDNLIRFSWQVPNGPAELGRSIQTLGYDIFWAENDLGPLDLRNSIPTALHKINAQPITVSGPPASDGPDSFLAMDRAENHQGLLPPWKRGQTYYYYVVPIDILGRYGDTSTALEATVVDGQPPRAVWGVSTMEVRDETNALVPHLALSWDRIDSANFAREYGLDKTICSANKERICFTEARNICGKTPNMTCEDFDISHYAIFRYDTPEQAVAANGMDTDGDLWIDVVENEMGTDPCNASSHPNGNPPGLIKIIDARDQSHETEISPGHVKITYTDTDIGPDQVGRVYWYRVVAVDQAGNAGPVSPPIRGILYNRLQPVARSFMQVQTCENEAGFIPDSTCSLATNPDDLFLFFDQDKQAAKYSLWKQCPEGKIQLTSGAMEPSGITHVPDTILSAFDCKNPAPCTGGDPGRYFINFFDAQGSYLSRTEISLGDLCNPSYQGCVFLARSCSWEDLTSGGGPGRVPENGKVQVCVELENGQMARVYMDDNSNTSPFAYITTNDCDFSSDPLCLSCEELESPQGLTAADYCVGVRVFSRDHVGSVMRHLGCLEMPAMPRMDQKAVVPAPMLASVESDPVSQAFDIRWASQESNADNFTLMMSSPGRAKVVGIHSMEPGPDHQFSYSLALSADELNKRWCFKMKAINSAMQISRWSNEICAVYETVPDETALSWPPVDLPLEADTQLTAFYLETAPQAQDTGVPVILLSDDLSACLSAENSGCVDDLLDCPGANEKIPCLANTGQPVDGCRLCDLARSSMKLNQFIVYRQVEGQDFVQVSPLIEKIHCVVDDSGAVRVDKLNDPFIYLVDINAAAVSGGIDSSLVTGARLIFRDRYPHVLGTRIRYKVLIMNPATGEIKTIQQTNWVNTPGTQQST